MESTPHQTLEEKAVYEQQREQSREGKGECEMTTKPLEDREVFLVEEVIDALKRVDETECSREVWDTIQCAIEDLQACI